MSGKPEWMESDVIGRASDLMSEEEKKVVVRTPEKQLIHPLVSIEELERGSPKPFKGRPDPDYPELDSGEPLYIPRFLLRRWGEQKFLRSGYYKLWESEANRAQRIFSDPKPSDRKKRSK